MEEKKQMDPIALVINGEQVDILDYMESLISGVALMESDVRTDELCAKEYLDLRDLRHQLRRHERDFSYDGNKAPKKGSSWSDVLSLCYKLLAKTGRDLELTVWFIEALIREYAFLGFYWGLHLAEHLLGHYQAEMYPKQERRAFDIDKPNEGLPCVDLTALQSLSGNYTQGSLISVVNLTPWMQMGGKGIAYWDYLQAKEHATTTKNKKELEDGAEKLSAIIACAKTQPPGFFAASLEQVQASVHKLDAISKQCTEIESQHVEQAHYERVDVDFSNLRQALNQIKKGLVHLDKVSRAAKEQKAIEEAELHASSHEEQEALAEVEGGHDADLTGGQAAEGGQAPRQRETIHDVAGARSCDTRGQAVLHIKMACNFFQKHNPHSPMGPLLVRALEWADMDFKGIMNAIFKNEGINNDLKNIFGEVLAEKNDKKR